MGRHLHTFCHPLRPRLTSATLRRVAPRRFILRHFLVTIVLLVALSEALILQWTRLATGLPQLGPWQFALAAVGMATANLGFAVVLRRIRRSGVPGRALMFGFLTLSLGALCSGPLVAIALAGGYLSDPFAIAGGGAGLALGFGSILWGFSLGQMRVAVELVPIPIRDLPEALDGFEIAHITDLHIGPLLRADRLRGFVDRVNAVGADAIAITGDIFDFDPAFIEEGCRELARLRAPGGVYAILGNHDVYTGADLVAEQLRSLTQIQVLRDEWSKIDANGETVYMLGIEDPGRNFASESIDGSAMRRLVNEVPDVPARVMLVHRPSYFEIVSELGLPLALAGHTHGGQVALPGIGRSVNISRLMTEYTRGLYERGGSFMYVNRGLGVAGAAIRLNCPREIARVRLTRSVAP